MSEIVHGKMVYTALEEMVTPGRCAVIVVDMQNEFCHPEGEGAKRGRSYQAAEKIIPRIKSFCDSARAVGIPIIYLMNTHRADALYHSSAELGRRMKKTGGDPLFWTIEGTWGHQIVEPLAPIAKDIIVRKHRPSGFYQTDIEMVLRNLNIECVIITGVVPADVLNRPPATPYPGTSTF